jgi:DNA relaxase NicK
MVDERTRADDDYRTTMTPEEAAQAREEGLPEHAIDEVRPDPDETGEPRVDDDIPLYVPPPR